MLIKMADSEAKQHLVIPLICGFEALTVLVKQPCYTQTNNLWIMGKKNKLFFFYLNVPPN